MAKVNPFRFSTKYQDDESDLLYYGYRYYKASTGTWLSRDPKEEKRGSKNLYEFLRDSPVNAYEVLGLYSVSSCQKNVDDIMANPGKYSKELRKVLSAINSTKGCKPLKPQCRCCKYSGYVQGNTLNICANNIDSTALLLETLVHENTHVLQKCRGNKMDTCDSDACAEIQAALNDGTCQRTSPGDVRSCVINEAAESVTATGLCGSREDSLARVQALYDSCSQAMP